MVEFPDVEERRVMLSRLLGIENKIYVHVADFGRVFAIADEDLERANEEKTSAVHFLRFELPSRQVVALKSGALLAIGSDHENYRLEVCPVADIIRASSARLIGAWILRVHATVIQARIPPGTLNIRMFESGNLITGYLIDE